MQRSFTSGLLALELFLLAGCASENPSASISDPAVYTSSHIAAVPITLSRPPHPGSSALDPTMGAVPFRTVTDELMRYFRQYEASETRPAQRLTLDVMLDKQQQARSLAQLISRRIAVELNVQAGAAQASQQGPSDRHAADAQGAATTTRQPETPEKDPARTPDKPNTQDDAAKTADGNPPPSPAEPPPASTQPATAPAVKPAEPAAPRIQTPILSQADKEALESVLTESVADSPFDQLDRAVDFYTAFLLKLLPGVGRDTRVLDSGLLASAVALGGPVDGIAATIDPQEFDRIVKNVKDTSERLDEAKKAEADERVNVEKMTQLAAELRRASDKNSTSLETLTQTREQMINARVDKILDQRSRLAKVVDKVDWTDAAKKEARGEAESTDEIKTLTASIDAQATALQSASQAADQAASNETTARERLALAESQAREAQAARDRADAELKTLRDQTVARGRPAEPRLPDADEQGVDRLLLLTLQTHVHPGTRPNTMTGVRVRIVDATLNSGTVGAGRWAGLAGADLVKVVRLHPTRSYDVESQAFADLANDVLQATLKGAGKVGSEVSIGGSVDADRVEEIRERRRFLSRLTKATSFADASNHEFGWNFLPTNLNITERSFLAHVGDALTFRNRGRFEIDAYLEGGARDCAVWLIVPKELNRIELEVEHVVANVDPLALDLTESRWYWDDQSVKREVDPSGKHGRPQRITVTLPEWNAREAMAYFRSAPGGAQEAVPAGQ